ncbi:MAG TPA: hypothetical protein VHL08_01400 [Dongiaceae bacterium]|jgi:hypothetical protein|nr:hypothetical protein [Dongiaceae bacterium]
MNSCVFERVGPQEVRAIPFPHLVRQHALDPASYEALAAEFPAMEVVLDGRPNKGSNYAARMPAYKSLRNPRVSERWKKFMRHHTSADHWRDILRLFQSHFEETYPDLERRIGRKMRDWRVAPRYESGDFDVRLDCQFVINTPVTEKAISVRTGHIDRPVTIFTALLYVRRPEDIAGGGDLELFAWRRPPRFLRDRGCLPEDIQVAERVAYQGNTFACFINSPLSVHGVTPREVTPAPRQYINFIVETPVPMFSYRNIGPLGRFLATLKGTNYTPRDTGRDKY